MTQSDNLRGALFMVAAMAAFALEDMFVKTLTQSLPLGQVLILFGLGGIPIFMAMAWRRGETALHQALLTRPLIVRSACEITGRVCYTLAIALTPLSSASAILQATPLAVAAGAVLFFGEKVGWRRWAAIAVGFSGVLLILKPGPDGFEAASLFAVAGTLGFAGRDLATRAAPKGMSNAQLGVIGFAMLIVAGAPMLAVTGGAAWPDAQGWALLAGTIIAGVLAYSALTGAMRVGELSLVAPFRYTRLIFATLLGVLVFHERPDAMTLLGGAIVVGSGLYTVLRARRQMP
jgi:drug/metabolite transporter (DMT)-like permease